MDYDALKAEIDTDPKNLGYSGKNNEEIVLLLNNIGLSDETVARGVISAHEIVSACDFNELRLLSDKEQAQLLFIVSAGQVNTSDTNIKTIFAGLFSNGTTTRMNLLALADRAVSRAEALGFNIIEIWDVERAKLLGVE